MTPPMSDTELADAIAGAEYINDPHGKPGGGKTTIGTLADAVLALRSRLAAAEQTASSWIQRADHVQIDLSIATRERDEARAKLAEVSDMSIKVKSLQRSLEMSGQTVATLTAQRDQAVAELARFKTAAAEHLHLDMQDIVNGTRSRAAIEREMTEAVAAFADEQAAEFDEDDIASPLATLRSFAADIRNGAHKEGR